ncbi:MAG: quinone oxidoreductase [Sphingomonadales bacterium]
MQAIEISEFGPAEVMKYVERPTPEPGPDQVRVRHSAIGLNFIDTYHRSGLYAVELPFTPGTEAAGVIDALGEGVSSAKVGDRVVYNSRSLGAYAEANIVDAEAIIPLPDGVPERLAASLTLKGMTAHYLLKSSFTVSAGDWVLVHAAAGATGSILVQWLVHLGAMVIGTVGSAEKAEAAAKLGAHHVINYQEADFAEEVRRITDGRGVDVVYDGVGKSTARGSMASLKRRGMFVSFGNASGAVEPIAPLELMKAGSIYLTRPTLADFTRTREERLRRAGELFDLISSRVIGAEVANVYPLSDAGQAHKDLEARKIRGLSVLIP